MGTICSNCGLENTVGRTICKQCRASLAPPICPACGLENTPGRTTCQECRAALPVVAPPVISPSLAVSATPTATARVPLRSLLPALLGLLVLPFLLVSIAIYLDTANIVSFSWPLVGQGFFYGPILVSVFFVLLLPLSGLRRAIVALVYVPVMYALLQSYALILWVILCSAMHRPNCII